MPVVLDRLQRLDERDALAATHKHSHIPVGHTRTHKPRADSTQAMGVAPIDVSSLLVYADGK